MTPFSAPGALAPHLPRRDLPVGSIAMGLVLVMLATLLQVQPHLEVPWLSGSGPGEFRSATTRAEPSSYLARLPLRFEPNVGQSDASVRFLGRLGATSLAVRTSGVELSLPTSATAATEGGGPNTQAGLGITFEGGNPAPQIIGLDRQEGITNYLVGKDPAGWHTRIANYAKVKYVGLWPGIDAVFYDNGGTLEYDFNVAAGADPGVIRLSFTGSRSLRLDDRGALVATLVDGTIVRQGKPVAYQRAEGQRQAIASRYLLSGTSARFGLGLYDRSRPLIIDPTLTSSVFTGETGVFSRIAVDPAGGVYVTGGSPNPTLHGEGNELGQQLGALSVLKIDPATSELAYATYFGESDDKVRDIAVNTVGEAYVVGYTKSHAFPTTDNAFQPDYNDPASCNVDPAVLARQLVLQSEACDDTDAFLSVLTAQGDGLVYSTYLGGQGAEDRSGFPVYKDGPGGGLAVDAAGTAFITGGTLSLDFPTTPGSLQPEVPPVPPDRLPPTSLGPGAPPPPHAYLTRLDPRATSPPDSLMYSTYLGGSAEDWGHAVAVDSDGVAVVLGRTHSSDFPTKNAVQPTLRPDPSPDSYAGNAFVLRIDPSSGGQADLVFSTYLQGIQRVESVAVAPSSGRAYLVGTSPWDTFTTTADAFQATRRGATDLVVAVFDPSGQRPYATYLGGTEEEIRTTADYAGIAVDSAGTAWLTGASQSTDFPVVNPYQPSHAGFTPSHNGFSRVDVIVAALDPSKPGPAGLVFSTYLGGADADMGTGIALGPGGAAYVTGYTESQHFPVTDNRRNIVPEAEKFVFNVFVAVFASGNPVPALATPTPVVRSVTPPGGPSTGGSWVRLDGKLFTSDATVRFGRVSVPVADVRYVSATKLMAKTPPHPPGEVRVTVSTGVVAPQTAASSFTYGPASWKPTGTLLVPRSRHSATLLDGPACRRQPSLLALGGATKPAWCGKILVAGGVNHRDGIDTGPIEGVDTGGVETLSSAELVDPSTGQAQPITSLVTARSGHTATLLDGPECHENLAPDYCGRVLVVGGDGVVSSSAELYDPAKGLWLAAGSLNVRRSFHSATLLSGPLCQATRACGKVLVAGGTASNQGESVTPPTAEIYDPLSGTWALTAPMHEGRLGHTATVLASGRILVAGGVGSCVGVPETSSSCPDPLTPETLLFYLGSLLPNGVRVPVASAELFDPATNTWTLTGRLTVPRAVHASALVGTSEALVSGGIISYQSASSVLTNSSELYDESTGTWRPGPPLSEPRAGHAATALGDGTVVITGGGTAGLEMGLFGRQPPPSVSSEVFDPALNGGSGGWRSKSFMGWARGFHTATSLEGPGCGEASSPRCRSVVVTGGVWGGTASREDGTSGLPCEEYSRGCLSHNSVETYTPPPVVRGLRSASSGSPAMGPVAGGTTVTIDGEWLSGATSVRFGDSEASSFRVDSPHQITAVSPPNDRGPAQVTVDTPAGSSNFGVADPRASFVYAGDPPPVDSLHAEALSSTSVRLRFSGPDDGTTLRRATTYIVKQSTSPITPASFDDATSLCQAGRCSFDNPAEEVELAVEDLAAETTYFYAVKAVGPLGAVGEMSKVVSVITGAATSAAACPPVQASTGQHLLGGGRYRIVGYPEATIVGSTSPLYGWLDAGAGGTYLMQPSSDPVVAGRGYWAWSACDRAVTLAVGGPNSVKLPLGAYHASMVGNPSGSSPATATGHDFAAAWDPDANGGAGGYQISAYREPQLLAVGEGTWVFAYVPTEIKITAQP